MSKQTFNFDLSAPGAVDRLLAMHKRNFGPAVMSAQPTTPPDPSVITVPATPVEQPPAPAPVFDEEAFLKSPTVIALLEQARKQEKDKLYPQLSELKSQVETLSASKQAEIEAAAEAARKAAEEEARKRFEESSAKDLVKEVQSEWEAKFQQLQAEREQERATFEKEREFAQLRDYTQQAVQSAIQNEEIAPELAHLVAGNNVDEINASLENIKATSAKIAESVKAAMAVAPVPVAPRGVAPTGYTPVGPMDMVNGTRTISAEELRNMPMSEYAKLRGQLGVDRAHANVGLFGN